MNDTRKQLEVCSRFPQLRGSDEALAGREECAQRLQPTWQHDAWVKLPGRQGEVGRGVKLIAVNN
eukprot:509551-Hanusia_phi.AAC.3